MIRPMVSNDLEWVRQERNNPECKRWFRQDHDITPEEQAQWFATTTMKSFVIDDKKGVVSLSHFDDKAKKCEFSIMVTPENRGKGYARKALRELLEYAFNELDMNMVYSHVFEDNPAMSLYTGLGFKLYGKLPNWYFKDGKYINSIVIAVTKDEYNSLKQTV